jgi:futalosine hydrolase
MITLCAATEKEIAPSIQTIQDNDLPVAVLITGVGMLATAFSISEYIFQYKPSLILQAGIAGSLRSVTTSTVVVASEYIADLGVKEGQRFKSVFEMGLANANAFPFKNGKLVNPHTELLEGTGLQQVSSITVNEISTDPDRIEHYKTVSGAEIESMEGAALHYCALMTKTPFLQLRAISNDIGERDISKWKMEESIASLNREIQNIIQKRLSL